MRSLCGAAAFVGVASGCLASSGELPPFYHTTSQIREQLQELADSCEGFSVEHESIGNGHTVDIVQLSRVENAPHRFFMLAGEHARELISAESALHFLQVLCGKEGKLRDKANKVLQHTQFRVVVNGNPVSREKVENGDFCLRVNENHVDLNRNWSDHWAAPSANSDTNPGPKAFSEPETRSFAKAVKSFKPHTFLSVHSGTLGMYMPWAFSSSEPKRNEQAMESILREVDRSFCQCPYGPAGKEVGYRSSGTCLDYVYDKLETPLAFAFEIYALPDRQPALHDAWKKETQFLDAHSDFSGITPRLRLRINDSPRFAIIPESALAYAECFEQFNPSTEDEFSQTLLNWSEAFLDLTERSKEALESL